MAHLKGEGQVLVRPDGYLAGISRGDWEQDFREQTRLLAP